LAGAADAIQSSEEARVHLVRYLDVLTRSVLGGNGKKTNLVSSLGESAGGGRRVADYYASIARAVGGAGTDESRRSIYDRARTAQLTQLRKLEPRLSETEINRTLAEAA
jgi:hypothetical protein